MCVHTRKIFHSSIINNGKQQQQYTTAPHTNRKLNIRLIVFISLFRLSEIVTSISIPINNAVQIKRILMENDGKPHFECK